MRTANTLTAAYKFKEAGDEVEAAGVPLLTEYRGHQSLRKLVAQGYQITTF